VLLDNRVEERGMTPGYAP